MIENKVQCPEFFIVNWETYQGRIQKPEMVLGNAIRVQRYCLGENKNCPEGCPIQKLILKLQK